MIQKTVVPSLITFSPKESRRYQTQNDISRLHFREVGNLRKKIVCVFTLHRKNKRRRGKNPRSAKNRCHYRTRERNDEKSPVSLKGPNFFVDRENVFNETSDKKEITLYVLDSRLFHTDRLNGNGYESREGEKGVPAK